MAEIGHPQVDRGVRRGPSLNCQFAGRVQVQPAGLSQQAAAVDGDDRAVDKGHRGRQPEDQLRHFLKSPALPRCGGVRDMIRHWGPPVRFERE